MASLTFRHSGHAGDVIYALPAIREVGGGEVILVPGHLQRCDGHIWAVDEAEALRPLLEAQGYVTKVRVTTDKEVEADHCLDQFRTRLRPGMTLVEAQAEHLGVGGRNLSHEAWLDGIEPDNDYTETIVFARSARHRGPAGFWERAVEVFISGGGKVRFIGTSQEHEMFSSLYEPIIRLPTPDLLCVARILAACRFLVANQSAPWAILEGLKRPGIQETCSDALNCFFPRVNAVHVVGSKDIALLSWETVQRLELVYAPP